MFNEAQNWPTGATGPVGATGPRERWHRIEPKGWWDVSARIWPWRRYLNFNIESTMQYRTDKRMARQMIAEEFGPRPDAPNGEGSPSRYYYSPQADGEDH